MYEAVSTSLRHPVPPPLSGPQVRERKTQTGDKGSDSDGSGRAAAQRKAGGALPAADGCETPLVGYTGKEITGLGTRPSVLTHV